MKWPFCHSVSGFVWPTAKETDFSKVRFGDESKAAKVAAGCRELTVVAEDYGKKRVLQYTLHVLEKGPVLPRFTVET
jgi:hypothetical protein